MKLGDKVTWTKVDEQEPKNLMEYELKPCPFCGSDEVDLGVGEKYDGEDYYITCYECGMTTDTYAKPEFIVERWNRRAGDA